MTSSLLAHVVCIAVLMGSMECVRCESPPSADRKQSDESGPPPDETRFLPDNDVTAAAAKRKWGENTMSTWGKRSPEPSDDLASVPSKKPRCPEELTSRNRRKWGETSMSAWGKRSAAAAATSGCEDDDVEPINGERNEKRKWGENTMQVWGKRAASLLDDEDADDVDVSTSVVKRKWGDKGMSAWGKRRRETADEASSNRKWGSNSMTAWGKRGQPMSKSTPSRRVLNDVLDSEDNADVVKGTASEVNDDRLDSSVRSSTEHGVKNLSAILKGWNRRHHGVAWSPKRRWEMNTMKVWGKRTSQEPSEEDDEE